MIVKNLKIPLRLRRSSIVAIVLIFTVFCAQVFSAQAASDTTAIATLYSLEGQAERRSAGTAEWRPCSQGAAFYGGDEIRVGHYSRAGIQFSDGLYIRLSSKASLRFDLAPDQPGSASSLYLADGKAHLLNRENGSTPDIDTSVVSAAVRGTEFVVEAGDNRTVITTIEGSVEAKNSYGAALLAAGEQAVTVKGSAPQKRLLLSPRDAVQWTAEVPLIFEWQNFRSVLPHPFAEVERDVRHRNLGRALATVRTAPLAEPVAPIGGATTPARVSSLWKLLEAEILLALGEIDEAAKILTSQDWSAAGPHAASLAASHLSLIILARNDSAKARELAETARRQDPTSANTALARSYMAQADKNLAGAREILRAACQAHPQNALLLSRLAELELGFGDRKTAEQLVESALAVDPDASYPLIVQGFIRLVEADSKSAHALFQRAAAADPGNGLPLLGLGLTKIFDGDLAAGRNEIARAAHLEPTRAIFRSYLGKAFFELEDEQHAAREYNEAIRLDPRDPTPWLYRGFYQISNNRLVDALRDVEQSFELNENRAVYRSSLLLDRDLAVRSAGLSRVFNEIGFSEAGRLEAIKSLNKDYTNFSAHRLLADSGREIFFADAAFSERRLADLLAPLSFNLFSTTGGRASFNEYDALFDMSQRRTAVNLEYDERSDLFLTELTNSGKGANYGYAMSGSTAFGDGRERGNSSRDYRLDGALRYQPMPGQKLLFDAHGIYNRVEDDSSDPQEVELSHGSVGLAMSSELDTKSMLLTELTVARERARSRRFDSPRPADSTQIFEGSIDTLADELFLDEKLAEYLTSVRGGTQYIYQGDTLSTVLGLQAIHEEPSRYEHSLLVDDALGELAVYQLELDSAAINSISGTDLYVYPTWHLLPGLDLSLGVTRSDLETEYREIAPFVSGDRRQGRWNPKVGFTATPNKSLTLRGAYFESLRKSSLEDQVSIEPTLVGGIPQRFNDLSGTASRNLGFGLDYKLAGSTYFGGEYIRRHLIEPNRDVFTEIITDIDNEEISQTLTLEPGYELHTEQDFLRGYIYQVLGDSFSLTLDYRYGTEEITDTELASDFLLHRAAAQLNYFAPGGFFAFGRATWRKQSAINDPFLDSAEDGSGKEIVWVMDAGIGYRLPKRRGTVRLELLNLADRSFQLDQSHGFEDFVKSDLALRAVASVNF